MTDTRTGAAFRGLWLKLLVLVLAAMALELATAQAARNAGAQAPQGTAPGEAQVVHDAGPPPGGV